MVSRHFGNDERRVLPADVMVSDTQAASPSNIEPGGGIRTAIAPPLQN
jgi:hypothetical protein